MFFALSRVPSLVLYATIGTTACVSGYRLLSYTPLLAQPLVYPGTVSCPIRHYWHNRLCIRVPSLVLYATIGTTACVSGYRLLSYTPLLAQPLVYPGTLSCPMRHYWHNRLCIRVPSLVLYATIGTTACVSGYRLLSYTPLLAQPLVYPGTVSCPMRHYWHNRLCIRVPSLVLYAIIGTTACVSGYRLLSYAPLLAQPLVYPQAQVHLWCLQVLLSCFASFWKSCW